MTKLLGKWLKVYEDEIGLFLWSTLLFFLIHLSDILLNNFGETAFLKRFGVEYLPVIYMTNAVVTFFIMGVLTGIMAKIPGSRLLSYMLVVSGISIGLIRLLIPFGFQFIYPVIYVLKSQYEVLLGLLFWDMANDLFNTRQSKRIFPLLSAAGVFGGILGGFITPTLARTIHIDNIMLVYMISCILAALVVYRMGSLFPSLKIVEKAKGAKKTGSSIMNEVRKVIPIMKESKLAKILVVLTLMPNIVIPIINFQFNFAVDQTYGTEGGMLKFFGYFRGSMNIISFGILLFVGRIYGKWGLPVALLFHPCNYVIAFLAYLFKFDIFTAMYSQISTTVLRNTINNPARSVLMGLFPPEHRAVVRPFLRGTVVRVGILVGSGFILLCQGIMHPRYLSLFAIAFVFTWILSAVSLKRNYSRILLDLVSRNMLDIKSLEKQDVGQIFLDNRLQSQMVGNFLSSKGETSLWYAGLMRSLGFRNLEGHILKVVKDQDDKTAAGLLGFMSGETGPEPIPVYMDLVKRGNPVLTSSVLKAAARLPHQVSAPFLKSVFESDAQPEIKAYALSGLYALEPAQYDPKIRAWLSSEDPSEKKAGLISAGSSGNKDYIPRLLEILSPEKEPEIISAALEALRLLGAEGMNELSIPYLKHASEGVRRSAMNSMEITDDDGLRAFIPLLGDGSETIREEAMAKLQEAPYQNGQILIEMLSRPNRKLRDGIFSLLESLKISDVDVLKFARDQFERAYTHVAEWKSLDLLPECPEKKLLLDHLKQKKKDRVDTVLRTLSAQDRTGRLRLVHRGVLSSDARQRANALEALEDILGSGMAKGMVPLLEDFSPDRCLEAGKGFFQAGRFDSNPRELYSHLLEKGDWVTVLLSLQLMSKHGTDGLEGIPLEKLLKAKNPFVREMAHRFSDRNGHYSAREESDMEEKGISIPEKILHLRTIHIFEGLSVGELAAIASITEEVVYPKGTDIIKEGEKGETMYMIIEGDVSVIKGSPGGPEIVLDKIHAGDYFGEMALFEDLVRSATIRSDVDTRVLVLDKREFTEIVREYPLIALQICKVLSQRLRKLHERVRVYDDQPSAEPSEPMASHSPA